jgi:hypothetical protein
VKSLLTFLIIFIFSLSLAQCFTNFDFSLGRYLLDNDKEIKVSFNYDLENYQENNFLVRPVVNNGMIEIMNPEKGSWVSSFGLLSDLPFIQKEMFIKIKGFETQKSTLYFEIFNTASGDIYKTPEKSIWSKYVYKGYLEELRENLDLSFKESTESSQESFFIKVANLDVGKDKKDNSKNKDSIINAISYPFLFFIFFIIGYKVFKIRVKKNTLSLNDKMSK